jgi:predicted DNA binding CopG/RHH family protein
MARAQINLRCPQDEIEAAKSTATYYGLTLTLYIRSLLVQDRQQLEHEQMMSTTYPQKALQSR